MAVLSVFSRHNDLLASRTSVRSVTDEPKSVTVPDSTPTCIMQPPRDVAATETKADTRPTIPAPSSLEPTAMSDPPSLSCVTFADTSVPGVVDAKEQRAFERDRQRTKRPQDRRKAREQKTQHKSQQQQQQQHVKHGVQVRVGDVRRGREEASMGDNVNVLEGLQIVGGKEGKSGAATSLGDRKIEVQLEDLVRVARVRKEKAGDFELVPHIRSVVVLDDFDSETELDEAWEHIASSSATSSDEDEKADVKAPSYAQVLLAAKHK